MRPRPPTPGLGYWAQVAHGKTRQVPLSPANPKQSDVVIRDAAHTRRDAGSHSSPLAVVKTIDGREVR